MKIILNGELVSELVLPAFSELSSSGWMLGDGIFETLLSIDGKILALTRHLDRAYRSGEVLKMSLPNRLDVETCVVKLLSQSKEIKKGRLRATFLSSGDWVITHKALGAKPERISVIDYPYPKNEKSVLAGIKTISYGESAHAIRMAQLAGSDDAIFTNLAGNVAESALANVVWEDEAKFFTTPLSSGCLPGVTRELLIEKFGVKEIDISPIQLKEVDAIYLTSSIREIQQINRYGSSNFGVSKKGEKFISEFSNWTRGNLAQ